MTRSLHPVAGVITHPMPKVWPTVLHMLEDAAQEVPDSQAVLFGEESITYFDLHECVKQFAGRLHHQGIGAGTRVAVLMGNSLRMVIALFGIQYAGAQIVPLNPSYTDAELKPILEDADSDAVVFDSSLRDQLLDTVARFNTDMQFEIGEGQTYWGFACARDSAALPLPDSDSFAALLYTGGTTGRAKGVNLTHGAISTNVSQREALLPASTSGEQILVVTPMFHSYGLAMCYASVYSRSTLVLLEKYRTHDVLQLIADRRITIFAGSPTIFLGLMGNPKFEQSDLSSIKYSCSGSAALSMETLKRWENSVGTPIVEGYGQTEAGPVLTYNPLHGTRKVGSVGIPVPETALEIVDLETGEQVLSAGELGEIRARGPQIMSGYRGLLPETSVAIRDGWLYTGDIGEIDSDGYLYIRDRKKDMVIVSGFNVYPREIEEAIFSHSLVADVSVIGVPDDYRGESLVAIVVAAGDALTEECLREYLTQRLTKYKLPSQFLFVPSLPKTAVGKPDKVRLRREFLDRCACT